MSRGKKARGSTLQQKSLVSTSKTASTPWTSGECDFQSCSATSSSPSLLKSVAVSRISARYGSLNRKPSTAEQLRDRSKRENKEWSSIAPRADSNIACLTSSGDPASPWDSGRSSAVAGAVHSAHLASSPSCWELTMAFYRVALAGLVSN
jgi:hypothetical protein